MQIRHRVFTASIQQNPSKIWAKISGHHWQSSRLRPNCVSMKFNYIISLCSQIHPVLEDKQLSFHLDQWTRHIRNTKMFFGFLFYFTITNKRSFYCIHLCCCIFFDEFRLDSIRFISTSGLWWHTFCFKQITCILRNP